MAVQKKRISMSKKHIRQNFWKNKVYWAGIKAFSLAKSPGILKAFLYNKQVIYYIIKTWKSLEIILIDMNQRIR
uniref:Large ribosomal subunit protein bL32c n=1 Tax=Clematis taeguensis TaxID=2793139 RepID=A0A7T0IHK7_9MAGN|nr:ribosomal protein L32 [Clematis taeguensis]YP_010441128.1 ribosomal protein L32 [Clematis hexapetala]YP_010868986.1 ribosomal protein L32 [Clematis mandshurica]QPK41848.1 ribosomal protein L32 [Clematis taeguensis]UER93986.1 ribosomal protein L32 [Clematis hexapetala]UEX91363.1 ribosomal protein L32 [Clematis mandshurica]UTD46532.1 ribosomal protein L32 [Clematis hexapetala]WGU46402.1 ribosomal protein L32 [Clematis mandshurica]